MILPRPSYDRNRSLWHIAIRPSRWSGRSLLILWAILSVIWSASVAYDLYNRVTLQADMARDVERDLDDTIVPANCSGSACAGTGAATPFKTHLRQEWSDIAATYLRFGSTELGECAFGPPILFLIAGFAVVAVRRRRKRRSVTKAPTVKRETLNANTPLGAES